MRTLAWVLSFGVGFLSLSQEILWVRLVSFSQQGRPQAFSLVLVVFLVGIAAGSMLGRWACERSTHLLRQAGGALLVAAAFDLAALAVCGYTDLALTLEAPGRLARLLLLVALGAAFKGVLFPIVHHLGSDATAGRVGRSVSQVYLGNVMGATLGPIVTGFWLLDVLPLERVWALVALGTALLGLGAWLWDRRPGPVHHWAAPAVVLAGACWAWAQPPQVVARIAADDRPDVRLQHLVQNKHGVIHVEAEDSPGSGDITRGGNVYDGRISVDMAINANGLDRAYLMAALHPQPRRVLVVGLSTGAWAAAILGMPGIAHMDIVEINPGYQQLIAQYPQVAPVLSDPRVHLHIDDGRRWLRAHPQAQYDLIFQNTSYHWRAYMTLLLSREYLGELQSHLHTGGIVAANTTGSLDAYLTAASVFKHSVRYRNFVYMSQSPLHKRSDAQAVLQACTLWAQPAFVPALLAAGGLGHHLATDALEPVDDYLRRTLKGRQAGVISDLNLTPEFRHGQPPPFDWMKAWLPSDAGLLNP
jgi:spermidine synthase